MSDQGCLHKQLDPVILATGETVSQLCIDCFAALPPAFGCEDCDYEELRTASGWRTRILTQPCADHLGHAWLDPVKVPWAK